MGLSVQLNNIQRESQLEEMYKYYLLEENNKVVTKIQLQFEAAISVNFQYLSISVNLITFWQVKFTKSDLVMGVRTTSLLLFSQTRKGEVCYTKIVLFYSNFV